MKNGWKKLCKHKRIGLRYVFNDSFHDNSVFYSYVDEIKQPSMFTRMGRNGKDIII